MKNLLSSGPSNPEFALEPLNVLVGPNASGKSNLIEALSLLAAAPQDLQAPIRQGGGVQDWLWKGAERTATAAVEVTLDYPIGAPVAIRYRLSFSDTAGRFQLRDEAVESAEPLNTSEMRPYLYYRYQEGHPVINILAATSDNRLERRLTREDVKPDQ